MRKLFTTLLCGLALLPIAYAQSALPRAGEPVSTISLKSEKEFGSSLSFTINPTAENKKVEVDWGDGDLKSYTIKAGDMPFFRKVSGSLKGEKIVIYATLSELEAPAQGITAFEATHQEKLAILNLSENSLTKETLSLAGLVGLENLNVAKNKLTLLDVSQFSNLQFLTANDNPSLGGVLFSEQNSQLKQISLNKCDISTFYPVSLPQLNTLNLESNALVEIELGENYPEMTKLNLANNYIASIDLSGLPKLSTLNLSKNQLTAIDLKVQTALTGLFLAENKLKAIDIATLTDLTSLDIAGNEVSYLDTSKQPKLTDLNCSKNSIANLELGANAYLKNLRATYNNLAVLNLSANNKLVHIDLRHNPNMTSCSVNFLFATMWPCASSRVWSANLLLEGSNAEGADASVVTGSDYHWKLDITPGEATPCQELTFSLENEVTMGEVVLAQYDIASSSYLPITNKAMAGYPIRATYMPKEGYLFKSITINDKEVKSNPFILSEEGATIAVKWEQKNSFTLTTAPDQALSFALTTAEDTSIEIDWGNGTPVLYSMKAGVLKRFDQSTQGEKVIITGSFIVADFSSYPGMGMWDNQLKGLEVEGMGDLEELYLYMNPIQHLRLASLPKLRVLDCAYTGLESLDVRQNEQLQKLVCYGNSLASLDLSTNKQLVVLDARNNKLAKVDLSQNKSLTTLDLQNNLLETLDVASLTRLEALRLAGNRLKAIDVANNLELRTLTLGKNQIESVELAPLSKLQLLQLEENKIKQLDLSANSSLLYLNIANNGLSACQLNDIYALLPTYPSEVTIELPDNVSLRITAGETKNDNQLATSETTLATYKGWTPNSEGDGTGCEEAYIFIKPSENGVLKVRDLDNNEVPSGGKAKRGSQIVFVSNPNEGFELKGVNVNGKATEAESFTLEKATWLQAIFALDSRAIETSKLFVVVGREIHFSDLVREATLFDAMGSVVAKAVGTNLVIPATSVAGSYILSIQTAEENLNYKLVIAQ